MIEVLKQALEALDNNRQTHYYCEDTWYSCPKHEQGCANDSERDECNCGADEANIEIDAATTALRQAIAELESQEPVVTKNEKGLTLHIGWNNFSVGTKLYAHPPQRTLVVFPAMLRKMWSGGEVQAWLDENVNKEKNA